MKIHYRKYKTFDDVPKKHLNALKKLSLGWWGIMEYLVDEYIDYIDGHPIHYWPGGSKKTSYYRIPTIPRYIVIAYHAGIPIGWCIRDNRDGFSVYVKRSYRRKGIATKLAEHFLSMYPRNKNIVEVHGKKAKALMLEAVKINKLKKRIRQWH